MIGSLKRYTRKRKTILEMTDMSIHGKEVFWKERMPVCPYAQLFSDAQM
jgi:hypothetical protein